MKNNQCVQKRVALRLVQESLYFLLLVALLSSMAAARENVQPVHQLRAASGEHPLEPFLQWAHNRLATMSKIQDYSCTFIKRERINSKLGAYESAYLKVRHKPFSVYMHFLSPDKLKGREVIYVDGRNDGQLLAHLTGIRGKLLGTLYLDPNGYFATDGNRHPITEIGFLNLTKRLLEAGEHDTKFGECEVKTFSSKINGRACECIQVEHPIQRNDFRYHIARIYIDDELNIPIKYQSYKWPEKQGGKPLLIEEYMYLNVKLNNGFTDADFDLENTDYNFP